ncbi:MAG: transposase [Kiritimatiellia bacterium]
MMFLIDDNLRVHHANCLEQWLLERGDRIRLHFFPSYSPERNPDEYLNRDVKAAMSEKKNGQ